MQTQEITKSTKNNSAKTVPVFKQLTNEETDAFTESEDDSSLSSKLEQYNKSYPYEPKGLLIIPILVVGMEAKTHKMRQIQIESNRNYIFTQFNFDTKEGIVFIYAYKISANYLSDSIKAIPKYFRKRINYIICANNIHECDYEILRKEFMDVKYYFGNKFYNCVKKIVKKSDTHKLFIC